MLIVSKLLFFLCTISQLNYPNALTPEVSKQTPPLVIAHRGASGNAPENTLIAVMYALRAKADMIEVDVHLSGDGEVIVIHDATLDRTTDGQGPVESYSLAELKELDAGGWFDEKFEREPIPTLDEVMNVIDGQAKLLIEIKWGKKGRYEEIEKKVIDLIYSHHALEWVIVQSFEQGVVKEMQELAPEIELHKLVVRNIPILPLHFDERIQWGNMYKYKGVAAVNPWFKGINRRLVEKAHEKGFKLFTYTVNKEADMKKCIEYGVDGIITNYPVRLKKLLKEA